MNESATTGAESPEPIALAARYAAMARDVRQVRAHREELFGALESGSDPRVRAAALGALIRAGNQDVRRRAWRTGATSADVTVRRRAAELTPHLVTPAVSHIVNLIADTDELVADAACFAAGEVHWKQTSRTRVVAALIAAAHHEDALVRESAVAALGAIGDPAGLPAILAAGSDRPTVRRRAVLALAPFDGPEVEAALQSALTDSDWQTRQAAEDLRRPLGSQ